MSKEKFIPQSRRQFRRVERVVDCPELLVRPAQNHFDLTKHNISDGCTSTTSLFDEECGEVPAIFDPRVDRLELADQLLRDGQLRNSQKLAEKGAGSVVD